MDKFRAYKTLICLFYTENTTDPAPEEIGGGALLIVS